MKDTLVGKTLRDENNDEYIILAEITHKNIPCVYAMKIVEKDREGEKLFFQIVSEDNMHLVSIKSPKMIEALSNAMFKQNIQDDKPRKIKDVESISDYLAYLDDYYKSKVVTIL